MLCPSYTLPGPGKYGVTLNNKSGSVQTEVTVIQERVQCTADIPPFLKGKLSIVWQKQIQNAPMKLLIS